MENIIDNLKQENEINNTLYNNTKFNENNTSNMIYLKEKEKIFDELNKLYIKIKTSFEGERGSRLSDSYKEIKILYENDNKNVYQLLDSISTYVRLTIEEKAKYISQTKFEVVNIDDI